jgi:DNA-binding CsgD family transcriptional regulator
MAEVTPINRARRRLATATGALERRQLRLEQRVLTARPPIVWVCGGAGTGKTRLLEALRERLGERGGWIVLDDPDAEVLGYALETLTPRQGNSRTPPAASARSGRLLLASRPESVASQQLLKARAYGLVESIDEAELFLQPKEASAGEAELLASTGGWPWLWAAALEGRALEAQALLPSFLEREVLPHLPEGLQAALLAAAASATPLPSAALAQLGAERRAHPFLAGDDTGTRINGEWLRLALRSLRSGPAARGRGVRERLLGYYTGLPVPGSAIQALLEIGEQGAALEVFRRAGGAYYGYTQGYHALEHVLGLFAPDLERRSEEVFLARLWMLVKTGRTREALLRLEGRHPGLPVDLRNVRLSYRPELLLLRADMSLDLDGTPPLEVIGSWARLHAFMAPDDHLSRGMLYNSMAIGYLQADALVEALTLAEEALAAYEAARMPYLMHFMHVHLAEIALRQGRCAEAAKHVRCADEQLRASKQAFNSEHAIVESLESRLAFEEGRFDDCADEIEPLLTALAGGDSWPDLIPAVARQVVLAAFYRRGLKAAVEQLDRCTLAQSRRHGVTANVRLRVLRIRLLQAARRHAEAGMLLEELELATPLTPALEVESGLARLRHVVHERSRAERVRLSATLAQHPALENRQRISIALLQALAEHREGAPSVARRHLRMALREAAAHGLIAVLIEEGECLEPLLPGFIENPGPGNTGLAAFAASVLKRLKSLPAAPMHSKDLAGLSRQEHRVLAYVADGYTNKQIARALGLSASTVKFHLRAVFGKLGVRSRASLGEVARDRGIVT